MKIAFGPINLLSLDLSSVNVDPNMVPIQSDNSVSEPFKIVKI